ncbi:hypothetical protein [Bradyrhizobium erythrophlei]|uniref:Uncharacterized protein n=1 Tax=Bradyrhizobium erythrophlei TaxID=1437360 RepID=A0A1M5T9D3_9BRAD|nr:hypothetical protein [Bradyrhizobium erythrophlei]SHH47377.1 hypothetical protein SAMN05444169_7630 [Bradyrhizobium erythrophlei]
MARRPNNASISSLSSAFQAIIDPVVSLLDQDYNAADGAIHAFGHAQPSTEDAGLRIAVDSLIRQIYRQLAGTINSRSGTKFDNLTERFHKAQEWMLVHCDKYQNDSQGLSDDPRTYELEARLTLAEARYTAYCTIVNELSNVYLSLTGKQWKYVEMDTPAPVVKAVKQLTDAERKAKMANIMRLKDAQKDEADRVARSSEANMQLTSEIIAAAVAAQ